MCVCSASACCPRGVCRGRGGRSHFESRCGDQVLSRTEPCGCGVLAISRERAGCGGQLSAVGPRAGAHHVMVGGAARRLRGRRGGGGRRGGVWRAGQLDLERCRAVRITARCVLLPEGSPTVVGTTEAVGARDAGAMYLRRGTGWYLTSVQVTLGVCE